MPDLGKIYQHRADMMQRGDVLANEGEQRRVNEENMMTRARAGQAMNVLKYVQEDRKLAESLRVNERLLAQDGRMRIEFIGNAAKAAGSPDSPEYRAYMDTFMRSLRDPVKRAALLDPKTGVQAMTSIMDEALQASRVPQTSPSPRTEAAIGVVGAQRPSEFPTVAPNVQAARDRTRDELLADERAGRTQYTPALSEPQKPVYPPVPVRSPGMGDSAWQKMQSDHAKIVSDMNKDYQSEMERFTRNAREQRESQAKVEKDTVALQEQAVDAKRVRDAAVSNLSETLSTAKALASHKGLNRIVGPVAGQTPNFTGDALDAMTLYSNIVGAQIVGMLSDLKAQSKTGATGFGALSDRELALVKESASKLQRAQTKEQFDKHLAEYISRLQRMIRGVEENYSSGPWAQRESMPSGVRVTVE
jgi:hypothetical protein